MAFNPVTILTQATSAIPSLRYGLGVAGVVSAGLIALGVANDRPQFAILTFVFVLAGMFLLAIFVLAAKHVTGAMLTLQIQVIIWALTLVFVGLIIAFFTAFVFGKPETLAKLISVPPASVRDEGGALAAANPSTPPLGPSAVVAAASAAPVLVPVSMQFTFKDRDDNCDANRVVPVQWCLTQPGAKLRTWSGPSIQSANCGSQFQNIRKVDDKCLAVDARIKGCGYDNLIVARNCRGSGWLEGSFTLEGEAPAP